MGSIDRRGIILGLIGATGLSGAAAIYLGLQEGGGSGADGDGPDGGSVPQDGDGGSTGEPSSGDGGDGGSTTGGGTGDGGSGDGTPTDPPAGGDVLSGSRSPRSKEVRVVVTVARDREYVANEPVVLRDEGGSLDVREKRTSEGGTVQFYEGVGPPPCNPLVVELPDRGLSRDLGCFNGGETINEGFSL